MIKLFNFLIFFLFSASSINADNIWSREEIKDFRRGKEYLVKFDKSDLAYNGLDSIQFVDYAANINNTSSDNISTTLRFLEYEILKGLQSDENIDYLTKSDSRKQIKIYLKNITERAGLKAEVEFFYDGKAYSKKVKYVIKDGRWNTFEQLVKENSQKLAKKIINTMFDVKDGYFFE